MQRGLQRLIIKFFYIFANIVPFLYLIFTKLLKFISFKKKYIFYRSIYLRQLLFLVKKIFNQLNYNVPVTISQDKIILNINGVLINLDNINRYLKINDNKYHNGAKYLEDLFDFSNAKIFLDLGACVGEYSLYFAKKYPQSKIYSVEANPINLKQFKENIKINNVKENIKILENAISDLDNHNYSTIYKKQSSEVIITNTNNENLNKTITLSSIISNEKLNKIDFIKIDIESSNYKVAKCIINNASKIDCIQYEFSKGPRDIFLNLVEKVNDIYEYYILDEKENNFKIINLFDLKEKIKRSVFMEINGFDVYFKKKTSKIK